MKTLQGAPKTYLDHPVDDSLKVFCRRLLELANVEQMAREAVKFLLQSTFSLEDFPYVENNYSRTILHRHPSGFEAIMARWGRGAVTVIHGHPSFGFYYLLEGRLQVENFERDGNGVKKISERIWLPDESFSIRGRAERFDNGIHRIRVLDGSLSFHVYSDDGLKGECFEQVRH
jgi:hypothetical protein